MKWDKSINEIETRMAQGKEVEIQYHRKWARNDNEFVWENVDYLLPDELNGKPTKAVRTSWQIVEGSNFIIDTVHAWHDRNEQ